MGEIGDGESWRGGRAPYVAPVALAATGERAELARIIEAGHTAASRLPAGSGDWRIIGWASNGELGATAEARYRLHSWLYGWGRGDAWVSSGHSADWRAAVGIGGEW